MCGIVPAGMGKETLGLLNVLGPQNGRDKRDEHLGGPRPFDAEDPFLGLLSLAAAGRSEGQKGADLRSSKDLGREILFECQGLPIGREMIYEKLK